MKIFPISYYINTFNLEKIILIIFFILKFIKNDSIQNFKVIYISNNYYWVIKSDSIIYYNEANNISNSIYTLNGDQKITTVEESEMISFGEFKDNPDIGNLLIVKNYVYAILNGNYIFVISNLLILLDIQKYIHMNVFLIVAIILLGL